MTSSYELETCYFNVCFSVDLRGRIHWSMAEDLPKLWWLWWWRGVRGACVFAGLVVALRILIKNLALVSLAVVCES